MEKRWALLSVFGTAVISGFSIFANKFGVTGINSSVYVFARAIVVSIFLISIILLIGNFNKLKELSKKQWAWLAAIGLIGGSIPFLLFFRGLQLTSSSTASFIHKSMFIFVAVLAVFLLKEKLHKTLFISAVLILIGNYLFLNIKGISLDTGASLILIATLFWALENVLSKRLLENMDGSILAFGRMFFGAGFIMVYLFFSGELSLVATLNSGQLIWITLTSAILFLYLITWYNGLKYVKVTVATSILLFGSIVTTSLNYFFSEAKVDPSQLFGGLLITFGIALLVVLSERVTLPFPGHSRSV